MKPLFFAAGLVLALSLPAIGAEDPIRTRQMLMDSNGASAAVAGGMLKGEIPFNPVEAKAVIAAFAASASAFGDYFPEGSEDSTRSSAAPKIWEDHAAFEAEVGKYREATAKAVEMAGKDGPADLEAFKAEITPVLGSCGSCHKEWRVKN